MIDVGIYVNRHSACEYHRIYSASVDISGHDYLVALFAGVHYHALDRRSSSAHHEKGVSRAESLSRQHFRVLDDGYRVTEIVERLHGVDVNVHAVLAEELGKLHISSAALMSGDIKGHYSHAAEFSQRLIYRRICLGKLSHFRTRSFR